MKFKKSRLERTCSNCDKTINKGDLYGQKTKSIPVEQTYWSIDSRLKEEIPDWAWETVYFRKEFDWCELCGKQKEEA